MYAGCCVVLDTNDRFLRKITIGQSATEKGFTREVDLLISVFMRKQFIAFVDDVNYLLVCFCDILISTELVVVNGFDCLRNIHPLEVTSSKT